MDRLGIDPKDPILIAAREAYDATHTLRILSHYRSCESGVGEVSDEKAGRGGA
jgi:hypothetical protein